MMVPTLRFPEFRDAGDWEEAPLNQVATRCKQKNSLNELSRVLTNSAEFGVLDQRDFFDKDIANQSNLDGYYIVKKGDYVYNPRISKMAPVGPISKNNIGDGVMSPLYTVFRFNNYENSFYAHYFNSTCWHHYMRQASSTGARHDRMAISNDDFMALPLPISTHEEQQKIASCLSSIDELITAQSQKVDALLTHKKGLMQQLFPTDGETVPRLRFPEFQDAGEWKEKELDKICSSISSGKDKGDSSGKYVLYGSTGVIGQTSNGTYDGSFILAARVGANAGLLTKVTGKFGVTDNTLVIILNKSENIDFIFYSLEKFGLNKMVFGSGQPLITGGQLKDVGISLPSSQEQKKVTDCLSSIDDLITAQSQKLDALKTHKKGLMQQLFPVTDEVKA